MHSIQDKGTIYGSVTSGLVLSGKLTGLESVTGQVNIVPDTHFAISGTVSSKNEVHGLLSSYKTLVGELTIPDTVIPRNYGLITWNGSYLTVS